MIYVFILGITNNKYNKLGCYSVQLDSSWEEDWWEGGGVESMNEVILKLRTEFQFPIMPATGQQFCDGGGVVVWCGGRLGLL